MSLVQPHPISQDKPVIRRAGPDIWGPYGWKFIHFVTLGYPNSPTEEQKNNYKIFLTSIKHVLPCSICSNHYAENLEKTPLNDEVLSTRKNLIAWGIEMHNHVNRSNNKKVYTYEEGFEAIFESLKGCENTTSTKSDATIAEQVEQFSKTISQVSNTSINIPEIKEPFEQSSSKSNNILLIISIIINIILIVLLYNYFKK
jgi:hypothetical protein